MTEKKPQESRSDDLSTDDSDRPTEQLSDADSSPTEVRRTLPSDAREPSQGPTTPGPPPPSFAASTVIGRYRLLQKIGEGGMGEVWEGEQLEPVRRRVAVKVIKRGMDTRQVVARFEAERQALALMSHPNVARVFDAGETPRGRPYFVMEFVKGDPINRFCDRGRLSTRERLELMIQVCEGVQHAHQKGIIHRDLKPSNILVSVEGDGRPSPKIIDFGVAKATNQHLTERTLFTELGQLIGTPEYMSPEQAEMTGLDIDTRTDVYSLGVVLYELLAGALPFDPKGLRKAGLVEIQRRIREEDPPRPSTRVSSLGADSVGVAERRKTEAAQLVRRLRGDLDWITMKALDKDRSRRYGSAVDLAADLRRHLENEPVLAAQPSLVYRMRKFVRRHKLSVAAGVALAGALAAGVAGTAVGLVRARQAEARALESRDVALAERDRAEQAREEVEEVVDFMVELFEIADPEVNPGKEVSAREVLDRGAARIENELADRPLTKARLLQTMGVVYQSLGLYDVAGRHKESALAIRRSELGDRHADVARSLDGLSSLAFVEADYQKAEELAREALSIYREIHPGDHADIAGALSDVGVSLSARGDHVEAQRLYRESLEMARRLPDIDDEALEVYVRRLAIELDETGASAEAEALYRESLELCRKAYGEEHPRVAFALDNLAIFYHYDDQPEKAGPLYRESLAMLRRVYGEDHPEIAQTMGNLGNFLLATEGPEHGGTLSDLEEAEALHSGALEINRSFRPDHPFTADSLSGLAQIRALAGDLSEAERLFREALGVYRAKLDDSHTKTLTAKAELGSVLLRRGRVAEAEPLIQEAYADLIASGQEASEFEEVLEAMADLNEALGRPERAAEYRMQLDSGGVEEP